MPRRRHAGATRPLAADVADAAGAAGAHDQLLPLRAAHRAGDGGDVRSEPRPGGSPRGGKTLAAEAVRREPPDGPAHRRQPGAGFRAYRLYRQQLRAPRRGSLADPGGAGGQGEARDAQRIDLTKGVVGLSFDGIVGLRPTMAAGQLPGVAVAAEERIPAVLDLPTLREPGHDPVIRNRHGRGGRAGVPPAIRQRPQHGRAENCAGPGGR